MLRYDQRSKAGKGLSFAFPPSSLPPLPMGLLQTVCPGSLTGTMRQHGSPRLALGVRISLLGVRGAAGNTATTLSSLQTLNAMDYMLEKLVLSFLASRVSEELQSILQVWHVGRGACTGAVHS